MQHVADGIMHAYIDGALDALADAGELPGGATGADVRAHFATCADCRARLDDARALKEQAGLILDDAGSDAVDVPPFDMIGDRPHARRRRAWLPLAWAASLVLAIGAGWWASDIARDERITVATEFTRAAQPAEAAADDAELERAGPVAGAPAVHVQAPDAMTAEAVTDEPVMVASPGATPAVASSSMAEMAVTPLAGGNAGRAAGAAAPVARAEAESTAGAAHPDLDAFRAQLSAARADSSSWRRVDVGAAGAVGEQRVVMVVAGAGAAVYDVTAPTIGLGELVRARQWLETGEQIELVTARPRRVSLNDIVVTGAANPATAQRLAAPPAGARSLAAQAPSREAGAAGDAADGRARVDVVSSELLGDGIAEVMVWLPDDGIWVSIRGALPAAELAALAQRLVRLNGS